MLRQALGRQELWSGELRRDSLLEFFAPQCKSEWPRVRDNDKRCLALLIFPIIDTRSPFNLVRQLETFLRSAIKALTSHRAAGVCSIVLLALRIWGVTPKMLRDSEPVAGMETAWLGRLRTAQPLSQSPGGKHWFDSPTRHCTHARQFDRQDTGK